jgi:N-acetylneuraminate synthase
MQHDYERAHAKLAGQEGEGLVSDVQIGKRRIGDGQPCFIVAEAGSNHNRSLVQAKQLIDVAASAKADAVKFQVFRADRLYPRSAGVSDYLGTSESIHSVVAKMEMPYEWLPELTTYSQGKGLLFLASVFDEESVDKVDPYVGAFKIASYEITHIPFLRYVAARGKPVIISTGASDLNEVATAVDHFRQTGNDELILMQCTAAYPAPLESLNIRAIATLKSAFHVPVGLSDHSRDPLLGPLAAVGAGANLIEKHFTLSNALPGPDHRFALEPTELRLMVEKVRQAEKALGNGEKTVHPVERELRVFARRGIFAVRDIEVGDEMTRENLAILRCGKLQAGLEPKHLRELLGKHAKRNIPAESPIQRGDYA